MLLIVLSSCSPMKKAREAFASPKPDPIEVSETVKEQEGFTHLSKETPVWQIFSIIILCIIASCILSKNWRKKTQSKTFEKKPFSSSGPDITS